MFLRDPCGIVCIIVTYLAVFYADYVVTRWIILQTMQNRYFALTLIVLNIHLESTSFQFMGSSQRSILQYDCLFVGYGSCEGLHP